MMLDRMNNVITITLSDEESESLDMYPTGIVSLKEIVVNFFAGRVRIMQQGKDQKFLERYATLCTKDKNDIHRIISAAEQRAAQSITSGNISVSGGEGANNPQASAGVSG